MFAYFSGSILNITSRVPFQYILTNYLPNLSKLEQVDEMKAGNRFYKYCELRPTPMTLPKKQKDNKFHFQQMVNYLLKHDCVSKRYLNNQD